MFSKFPTSKIGLKPTCRSNRPGKQAEVGPRAQNVASGLKKAGVGLADWGTRLSRLAQEISGENLPQFIINLLGLQIRRTTYIFRSARQEERNGEVRSCI
jgi:hypothetical protein